MGGSGIFSGVWVTDNFVCYGVQGIFSATLQHINKLNFLGGDLSGFTPLPSLVPPAYARGALCRNRNNGKISRHFGD